MLLPILSVVVLSAISLSLVAFFLTHPREAASPTPHGEQKPRSQIAGSYGSSRRHSADAGGGQRADTPSSTVDEGGVR